MSKWKTYRADDFCLTVTDGTHDSPKPQPSGRYLITSKHLKSFEIDFSSANKITEEDYNKIIQRSKVEQYDILFSMIGTIGNIHRVTIPNVDFAVKNMGIFKMGGDAAKSLWMYYWLQSPEAKKYINSRITGSTQGYLTLKNLRDFPVCVPPLAEQKRIADILSAIDDKIELNRRINANLEQQAQALYKSWFVDNKKDDWEEKRLDDIISIYDSQRKPLSGQQREKMEKLYPYYGAASLMDYVDNYLFDGIYLLLGEDGTVSDSEGFPMLQYVWGKFWVNNHAHILQGKNGFTTESLYILLKQTNVSSIVTGAVQPKISQANLKSVPITMPPINLLNQYNNIIKPIFNQIRINHNQIQQLSTLRDTLLPKLMSGEIKV